MLQLLHFVSVPLFLLADLVVEHSGRDGMVLFHF